MYSQKGKITEVIKYDLWIFISICFTRHLTFRYFSPSREWNIILKLKKGYCLFKLFLINQNFHNFPPDCADGLNLLKAAVVLRIRSKSSRKMVVKYEYKEFPTSPDRGSVERRYPYWCSIMWTQLISIELITDITKWITKLNFPLGQRAPSEGVLQTSRGRK